MSSCNICIENITKFRYEVECHLCQFVACCECTKRYILDSTSDPGCMSCKKTWNREFISDNFSKKFVDVTLKKHRENILLDKEKALLPATQVFVEAEIRKEEIDVELGKFHRHIKQIQNKIRMLNEERRNLTDPVTNSHQKTFIRACAKNECKGFLTKDWFCGLCKSKTCSDCHEIEFDEHKCDPNSIETAKLLAKDTKCCPNCGTQIFKIEGCDQMFCTQCHTPFSWVTGQIDKGVIHNPHYFEWLRKNPNHVIERNPNDIRCGRLLDHNFIVEMNRVLPGINFDHILIICRNLNHMRQVELPRYRVDRVQNNRDLRIKYMRNFITEEQFKRTLQQREKDISKKTDILQVLQMVSDCSTDILYRLRDAVKKGDYLHATNKSDFINIRELIELQTYANDCLSAISYRYNSKCLSITDTFKVLH